MKKIKITLRKDGTQNFEVLGAIGDECVSFTRELENRLGKPIGDREFKPEYEMTETEVEQQRETDH